MRNVNLLAAILVTAGIGGVALAAQDRSTLKVPDGLSFSEFKGYESWETVTPSQNEQRLKIIAANPIMMRAFKNGLPAKGQSFPDGSRVVKLEWSRAVDSSSPAGPIVRPGALTAVEFIVKDTKRFPNTKGWAYAIFVNDPATQTLRPLGSGTVCGFACHSKVADQDYIFNRFAAR
jgi:hypothetical protein